MRAQGIGIAGRNGVSIHMHVYLEGMMVTVVTDAASGSESSDGSGTGDSAGRSRPMVVYGLDSAPTCLEASTIHDGRS